MSESDREHPCLFMYMKSTGMNLGNCPDPSVLWNTDTHLLVCVEEILNVPLVSFSLVISV